MNSTALKVITIALKVASVLTGLAAYGELIPAKYAPIGILVFAIASIAKDSLTKLGDLLDDGQANQSYKG